MQGMGETFVPHEFSGAAELSIPIPATPCRGFEPRLGIDFSSGDGNSEFGMGFSLSVPDISRRISKGVPRYDCNDTFILSGADLLVKALNDHNKPIVTPKTIGNKTYEVTRFMPRVESDFSRIEYFVNQKDGSDRFWKVTNGDNVTHIFGKSSTARIFDPNDKTHIFKWMPEESYDAKGNHIFYEYKKENSDNVPATISNTARDCQTNTYLGKVKYGNDKPVTGSLITGESGISPNEVTWHFEVAFDYGEYSIDPSNSTPHTIPKDNTWLHRQDPFSTYSAGFEIRTYRLCRHVLLFHYFPEVYNAPVLTRVLKLEYKAGPFFSFLKSAREEGRRFENDGDPPYQTRAMPALEFDYTPFLHTEKGYKSHGFEQFNELYGQTVKAVHDTPAFQMVDLYSEGLPGLLYTDGETVSYREPVKISENNVEYGCEHPIAFPMSCGAEDETHSLADINGAGKLDLMVSLPDQRGYYQMGDDHKWGGFTPFKSFPANFHYPYNSHADVTGNGLNDIVLLEEDNVRVNPSEGLAGYGAAFLHTRDFETPASKGDTPVEIIRFADMLGAGSAQRVRISNGMVECWPGLGYGKFGKKVVMENAPRFEDFHTERLMLADIDGSGLMDIAYIYPDSVEIYRNRSGNGFDIEPVKLHLPAQWSPLDKIFFTDVKGNGTSCLVFQKRGIVPRQWFYDFNLVKTTDNDGNPSVYSQKPYLLNKIDNNMGATTTINYACSTEFYLKDKACDIPWITTLASPVNVIASIVHTDAVSETTMTSSYWYRHGYFDGMEREFRGFGYVERTDSSGFKDFMPDTDPNKAAYNPPPAVTKTWYHTGAYLEDQDLIAQYRKEYWNDGTQPYKMPVTKFHLNQNISEPFVTREAHETLYGAVLRSETYGNDSTPWQKIPYSVSESQYCVKQLQEKAGNKYAAFFSYVMEDIDYDYERNGLDPKITHGFTIEIDKYGHILKHCIVNYGRRSGNIPPGMDLQTRAQQEKLWIYYEENKVINSPESTPVVDYYLLGAPKENLSYEINDLSPNDGEYFTYNYLKTNIPAALKKGSPLAELLHWERDYYFDAKTKKELPLGKITAQELLHRTEEVAFDRNKLESSDEFRFMKEDLKPLLTTGDSSKFHGAKGGYVTYSGNPREKLYYWNPGSSQSYYDHDTFYLPNAYFDPFQYYAVYFGSKTGVTPQTPKTSYKYDNSYYMMATSVVDPLGSLTTTEEIDYQTMQPIKIKDINNNVSEVLFDPLGMVIVSSHQGRQGSETVGFEPVSKYTPVPMPHEPKAPVPYRIVKDIMKNPKKYLQNTASFFYYDLHSWKEFGIPAHSVHLNYVDYTLINGEPNPTPESGIQKSVVYSNGFGRVLQSKEFFDFTGILSVYDPISKKIKNKQVDNCWWTSGAVRYDNKGRPIKQYEPFFAETYQYVDNKALHQVGYSPTLFYDALGRKVLVRTYEGFFEKTLFGNLDGENAAPKAHGYLNKKLYSNLNNFQPSPWSTLHYDTNDMLNEREYEPKAGSDVDKEAIQKTKKFADTPFFHILDSMERVVESRQLNVPPVEQNSVFTTYDILGDVLTQSDQRLHALVPSKNNFETIYNLEKKPVKTVSTDAGTEWTLADVMGNPIYSKDSRKFETYHSYDHLHRPIQTYVKGGDSASSLAQTVKRTIYGDNPFFSTPEKNNLRGKPVISLDEAGLSLSPLFTILGDTSLLGEWIKEDYKNQADWHDVKEAILELIAPIEHTETRSALSSIPLPPPLEKLMMTDRFITSRTHDALGRVTSSTDADGNVQGPVYYTTNRLKSLGVTAGPMAGKAGAGNDSTPDLQSITYNAKGQRTSEKSGNAITVGYTYDQKNFSLTGIESTKSNGTIIQNLIYHHDPVGNITSVTNKAALPVFFKNEKVDPKSDYTYDSLYRLKKATGREHAGMWKNVQKNQNRFNEAFYNTIGHQLTNGQALQRYTQNFEYDGGDNLTSIKNSKYNSSRKTVIHQDSNRIQNSSFGANNPVLLSYKYDKNGNMTTLDGLAGVTWNFRNNMASAIHIKRTGGDNDAEYYIYDGAGRRVRKISETKTDTGRTIHETLYAGGIEIRRKGKRANGSSSITYTKTWHSVRLMDGDSCFCDWRYWVKGDVKGGTKKNQLQYQLNDLLNSGILEVDEKADIISYEEYYPYGGAAIIAAKSQKEVKEKHYHYSGKEKDATGLYYYGMRYYAPWLGRWTCSDPAGTVDGLNIYAFVGGNPVTNVDVGGMGKAAKQAQKPKTPKAISQEKKKKQEKTAQAVHYVAVNDKDQISKILQQSCKLSHRRYPTAYGTMVQSGRQGPHIIAHVTTSLAIEAAKMNSRSPVKTLNSRLIPRPNQAQAQLRSIDRSSNQLNDPERRKKRFNFRKRYTKLYEEASAGNTTSAEKLLEYAPGQVYSLSAPAMPSMMAGKGETRQVAAKDIKNWANYPGHGEFPISTTMDSSTLNKKERIKANKRARQLGKFATSASPLSEDSSTSSDESDTLEE